MQSPQSIQLPETASLIDYRRLSGDERTWRAGEITPIDKYRERFIRRFWAKVDKSPGLGPWGNCWEWRGSMDRKDKISYGNFGVSSNHALALGFRSSVNVQKAHTAAWIVVYGNKIPAGHEMCHKCNNKPCIREDHLFTATHLVNIRHGQTTGIIRTAKPKAAPVDYHVWLSKPQCRTLRGDRKSRGVSIVDMAHMALMDVSHLSLIERSMRPVRLSQLVFMLDFLKINKDNFGLADCELIPVRRKKAQDAKYLQKKPAYTYRAITCDQFAQRRPPSWYSRLGAVSTDGYDAHALISTFQNAGVKQGDLARDTGLHVEALRDVLRGCAKKDEHLLRVLRHAETIRPVQPN